VAASAGGSGGIAVVVTKVLRSKKSAKEAGAKQIEMKEKW